MINRILISNVIILSTLMTVFLNVSCTTKTESESGKEYVTLDKYALAKRNLERSMILLDSSVSNYFVGQEMAMRRFYNPFTKKLSGELGSVWMYSSAIEAVNAILHSLQVAREHGHSDLYDKNFSRYTALLSKLYDNADYYLGTYELTSYTQTKTWTVYAVDRVNVKGKANVSGILNVYDDQIWLIRELLESYRITGQRNYLTKAEYLTDYVLDGWDTTLDDQGNEHGGITWGPGYVTKHSCSNGPLISPLVWLHKIYKSSNEQIEHRFIDPKDKQTRKSIMRAKGVHYLDYAKKLYNWQKSNLLNAQGVYTDMMGGCGSCQIAYETFDGVRYRNNTPLTEAVGEAYTYNSGTMLSGAVDLYRATGDHQYLRDGKELSEKSFSVFAKLDSTLPEHYRYNIGGFRNWFNGVLLRGYLNIQREHPAVNAYIESFQKNLDYGFSQFNHQGFLPTDLLRGWREDKTGKGLEGMFQFSFAAEYAGLARFNYENNKHNQQ